MEIITTPWKDRFLDLISSSKKSIKITSPFVTGNVCDDILRVKQLSSSFELITSFKIKYIHTGFVDIEGIEKIIRNNGTVKNFSILHAKIYLFDDKEVIITSANLTNSGLLKNFEYGIYSRDKKIVDKTIHDFNLISQNEDVGKVKLTDISAVKKMVAKIPKVDVEIPDYHIETPEKHNDIIELDSNIIASSLGGWKLEIFNCVNKIPNLYFTLDEINQFESQLKTKYPSNNNILPKIRQQLQFLRDLGLIEFLGNGEYKKLWK